MLFITFLLEENIYYINAHFYLCKKMIYGNKGLY
jgi:hypothetical protein